MNQDVLGAMLFAFCAIWAGHRLYLAIAKKTIFVAVNVLSRNSREYPASASEQPFYYRAQFIFFSLTLALSIGAMIWFLWGHVDI